MSEGLARTLLVALGGALGASARYGLGGLVHRLYGGVFPLGTAVVNLSGCVAIGLVMGALTELQVGGPASRLFLVTGVLGGFTTFSAFGWETAELMRGGALASVLVNVALQVVGGVGAVVLGRALVVLWRG